MALPESELPKLRSYEPLQLFFLLRLGRLLRLRHNAAGQPELADWLVRLLNKTIYSTYCDCERAGVGEDARSLFTKIATRYPA